MLGTNTFNCEVTNLTKIGFWVMIKSDPDDIEYFIPFQQFPEFLSSPVEKILLVTSLSPKQLHWESLDIDIEIESLQDSAKFPLHFNRFG